MSGAVSRSPSAAAARSPPIAEPPIPQTKTPADGVDSSRADSIRQSASRSWSGMPRTSSIIAGPGALGSNSLILGDHRVDKLGAGLDHPAGGEDRAAHPRSRTDRAALEQDRARDLGVGADLTAPRDH